MGASGGLAEQSSFRKQSRVVGGQAGLSRKGLAAWTGVCFSPV